MKKLRDAFLGMVTLSFLVSCSVAPSEKDVQTAIAKTQGAIALLSTNTPTATPSPTMTNTPTVTPTPTSTPSPTATETPTMPPATQTAIAQFTRDTRSTQVAGTTQTAVAEQATVARLLVEANITATASKIAATQTQISRNATATFNSFTGTQVFFGLHKSIDTRELVSYADAHKGEKVVVSGRVFSIIDSTTFQMWIGGSYDALIVDSADPLSGIYKDTLVTVYGTVGGYFSGTNSFGGAIKQPVLLKSFVVKQ